jgi:23S rRNA (uracil1939-C5)-methyltransferase
MSDEAVKVHVTGLAHGGEVIGRPEEASADQRKVFVRGGIPGEQVLVKIAEDHKNFRRGTLQGILVPSESRTLAPCSYFGSCGGCDYQHITIASQREFKRDMVESMLKRQGSVVPKQGVQLLGADLPSFEYRRRVTLHVGRSNAGECPTLGFYREGSTQIVDLSVCMLAAPKINCALQQLRGLLPVIEDAVAAITVEEHEGELFLAARLREDALERIDYEESPALTALAEEFDNLTILDRETILYTQYRKTPEAVTQRTFPAGKFSQVNTEGNAVLVDKVVSLVTLPEVTDLYAGAGNFSLPLAMAGKFVEAVELDPELVALGERLAFTNRIAAGRITFTQSSCEQYVKRHALKACVLLDPPRTGADAVAKVVDPKVTKQIIYVSCGLPTLCRDAKTLAARGFSLKHTWVVDMFAQTHHVETISVFES